MEEPEKYRWPQGVTTTGEKDRWDALVTDMAKQMTITFQQQAADVKSKQSQQQHSQPQLQQPPQQGDMDNAGTPTILMDARDVTQAIRDPNVTQNVHYAAAVPGVRQALLEKQRSLADTPGIKGRLSRLLEWVSFAH